MKNLKNFKVTLPVAIVIASIVLGGFFFAIQVNKQRSIEKQQQIKIEQEQEVKEEREQQARLDKMLLDERQLLQEQEKREKEALEQEQARIIADKENWDNLKEQVENSKTASNKIRTGAEYQISQNRDWLNEVYLTKTNPNYYKLLPLINASEHYITTLQSLVDSIDKLNSIRYKMLTAIDQQDFVVFDNLVEKESDAVDDMQYWFNQQQKEADEKNELKTEVIKNL